jgi:hypothetical protein
MSIQNASRSLRTLFTLIVFTGVASALPPDPKILSLISHDIEIVDGSSASPLKAGLISFLVFRSESATDLRDFKGLVGVDDSKAIRQIFLVGRTARPSPRFEHSLIALGRFNVGRIYKAAIQNGARSRDYRGMEILELAPFSRNRGLVNELRWLAILGSDLAVFGNTSQVREELDRHLDHVPADPLLIQKLTRLRPDDDTWCLFANLVEKDKIWQALSSLDPRILNLAPNGLQFQFGIHYGRRIRFDYELTGSPKGPVPIDRSNSAVHPANNPGVKAFISNSSADTGSVYGMISVSKARYRDWLSELSEPGRYKPTTFPPEKSANRGTDLRSLLCPAR